jgi:iron complex outermembrane recepter protein
MKKFLLLSTAAAAFVPTASFAQSTGTVTTEEDKEIVITATRSVQAVEGVSVPDTTKAKALITQDLIQKQSPGQTVLNVVNLVPSVNFTNSDAYGSSGGNIRIRGFDGNRISLTFDGVPLNDSGNYAIFSNQQMDPELIEQVNVGLGVTDVDSPTASAAGGTINYRTIIPSREFSARAAASIGEDSYQRLFGLIQSGDLNSAGTRAWIAGSVSRNDKFKGPGQIYKRQLNARVYHPLGNNGDFLSLAGHLNVNRNNFYRNPSVTDLRTLLGTTEIPSPTTSTVPNPFPTADNPLVIGDFSGDQWDTVYGFDNDPTCARANNTFIGCTNYYQVRINPSNTGNLRGQSRFTLSDNLILTVDPSFQYVLAHGGGTSSIAENSPRVRGSTPGSPGVDYTGDGDFNDTVRFFSPNITNTHRIGLTSSLIYDINPMHRVRVAYTYDRARHRQTGEWGYLDQDGGAPENVFSGRNGTPVLGADGFQFQQRDRKSIALLNQISGQYIGRFFDNALRLEVGIRRPFFKRNLETYCPIEAAGSAGFAYCTSEPILPRGSTFVPPAGTPNGSIPIFVNQGDVLPTNPAFRALYAPFDADYKFGKILPNVGFTYKFTPQISVFGSWAKGFSAPRTDNLYRAPLVELDPEETDAFDLGARYTSRIVQGQATLWKIDYKNRIVSSFNPDLGISLDRNVGKVASWGAEGSLAVKPIPQVALLGIVSYIDTELKENVELGTIAFGGTLPINTIYCGAPPTATSGPVATCAPTKGKFVTETPKWQYGGRVNVELGPVSFGIQGKRVGDRFATDTNDVKVKGYTLVDLDARVDLGFIARHLDKSFFQLNVNNLFDEEYFGNISTQINNAGNPNFSLGSPRTVMGTFSFGI